MSGVLTNGARFALKFQRSSPERVVYTALIELPEGAGFSREVTVDLGSSLTEASDFTAYGDATGSPPSWMVDFLETLTRQLVRGGLKSGVWPRKQRRWKGQP